MLHILFASRLVHEKWVDILIEAIRYFHSREWSQDIHWDICSDGEYENTIRDLAREYKNVTYHGKISKEALNTLYEKSDVLFMPSRFLEMFGLTALEALEHGTPVIWPRKWWLRDLISESYSLDENNPITSLEKILVELIKWEELPVTDIRDFSHEAWTTRITKLIEKDKNIAIIHDYEEKIWWAEYYIAFLREQIKNLWKNVSLHAYRGKTTPWKRRIMFVLSLIAFWRGIALWKGLRETQPTLIWLHSILRYMWPWWALAVRHYQRKTWARIILCHHDLGLLAAFPQDITSESMIPESTRLTDFIPKYTSLTKKIISIGKWCYVRLILSLLGKNIEHMVFASFLIPYVQKQAKKEDIILFPHTSL